MEKIKPHALSSCRKVFLQKRFTYSWIHRGSVLLLLLFVSFFNSVQSQTQTFTADGTFTVPVGVTSIDVVAKGAKGGTRANAGNGL